MTDAEILKAAMEKASKTGYKSVLSVVTQFFDMAEEYIKADQYYIYIFDHAFAKAFWGDQEHEKWEYAPEFIGETTVIPAYIFHLQQMVAYVDENGRQAPLKYIERFL